MNERVLTYPEDWDMILETLEPAKKIKKYSPDQERDSHGRFGSGDASSQNDKPKLSETCTLPNTKSASDINEWIIKVSEKHIGFYTGVSSNITRAQEVEIMKYISASWPPYYKDVNGALRSGGSGMTEEIQKTVDEMTSAIRDNIITEPFLCYRALSAEVFSGMTEGETLIDRGFVSTSLKESTAQLFKTEENQKFMMLISVPAGATALPIDLNSEAEMLFQRGSKFRVDSVDEFTKEVYATYVGVKDESLVKYPLDK